jgi:hypothetical protein
MMSPKFVPLRFHMKPARAAVVQDCALHNRLDRCEGRLCAIIKDALSKSWALQPLQRPAFTERAGAPRAFDGFDRVRDPFPTSCIPGKAPPPEILKPHMFQLHPGEALSSKVPRY